MDFAFYHGLIEDDSDEAAEAFEAIGRASATWSRFEAHLDALLIQVNKPQYALNFVQQHPVSFSKKLDLLKRWFNGYAPLSEFADDIREITSRAKILQKQNRNLFLHSIAASFDPVSRTIEFQNIHGRSDGNIYATHHSVTITQIAAFCEATNLLNDYLAMVTRQIFTHEWLEKLNKP